MRRKSVSYGACLGSSTRPLSNVPDSRDIRAVLRHSMDDIRRAAPKAKVLYCDRVPFEVAGGDYRLIAAFAFRRQIAFVKFVGTHDEYDAIDALTVARFSS